MSPEQQNAVRLVDCSSQRPSSAASLFKGSRYPDSNYDPYADSAFAPDELNLETINTKIKERAFLAAIMGKSRPGNRAVMLRDAHRVEKFTHFEF